MKKLLIISLAPLILSLSLHTFGQEIDPSLLEDLSPAQIELAKSQLAKSKSLEKPKPTVKESTKKIDSNEDINKSNNFTGLLKDLRVWNTLRTQEQIELSSTKEENKVSNPNKGIERTANPNANLII